MELTKVLLDEREIPRNWYNILADMPNRPQPPRHPGTGQVLGPEALEPLFPMELIMQEVSQEPEVAIPEEVLDILTLWRPTPLHRARNFEKALGTPARIYYKNEGVSPPGSHKPNTAVAQAYFNKKAGTRRITTETGAGQWGSALAFACNMLGIECKVYMVRISYDQKPYRRSMIQTWGAQVIPSPSNMTECGRKMLARDPESLGSLGLAISEAVEEAASREDTKYSLGSVLNHVLLHQTIIGQEAKAQMAKVGDYPDVVIGCHGGGSNLGGISLPFVRDKINGKDVDILAAEPAACPTLTKGIMTYDFGDTEGLTCLLPMYTLGHSFMPSGIHAGGLRYHGAAPIISQLLKDSLIRAEAYTQTGVFDAAVTFARTEGVIPAPESAHAIKAVVDEAMKAKEEGKAKAILFNLSGHGHFDMAAYDAYFSGSLHDYEYPAEMVKKALEEIPRFPGIS